MAAVTERTCVICGASIEHRRAHATVCKPCAGRRDCRARTERAPALQRQRLIVEQLAASARTHGWASTVENGPLHGWHVVVDVDGIQIRLVTSEDLDWLLRDLDARVAA